MDQESSSFESFLPPPANTPGDNRTQSLFDSINSTTRSRALRDLTLTGRANDPPPQLQLSPNRHYVIWTEETSGTFEQWLSNTPFFQAVEHQSEPRKFTMPKWNNNQRRSKEKTWDNFYEGVEIHQGVPKVICKYCSTAQNHPNITNQGTSNMIRHLTGPGCRKRGKRPTDVQAAIDRHFKKVNDYPILQECGINILIDTCSQV
jgi:hypothetical protein